MSTINVDNIAEYTSSGKINATHDIKMASGKSVLNSDGKAIGISDTITAESAGETITVRGQTDNYSYIIINKRFYELPADMLKLMDVKIKNHKNGNDKYRSVERTVYRPLEQDGDNI